jgi:type IV secretory pathway TraG/TraD family ATPase VirD4
MNLPYFSNIITTIRKRNVSISIILQSITQLEAKYGRQEADIILNGGIGSRIFYSGCDPNTSRMLSSIIGSKKVREEDSNYTRVESVVNDFNVRTLDDNCGVLVSGNKAPVLLDMVPYYKN